MSNEIKDRPLYGEENTSNETDLQFATEKFKAENRRKNKVLFFGFKMVVILLVFAFIMVIADIVVQSMKLDNDVVKTCLTTITHLLTMVAGYIFASNDNRK